MAPFYRVPEPLPEALQPALTGLALAPGQPTTGEAVLLAGPDLPSRIAALRSIHAGPIVAVAPLDAWPALLAAGCTRPVPAELDAATLGALLRQTALEYCQATERSLVVDTVLARSGVGIAVVDEDGRVRAYNDRARAVIGIDPDDARDAVGRPSKDYDVLAGSAHPAHHAAVNGVEVPEAVFDLVQGGSVRINVVPLLCGTRRMGAVAFIRPSNAPADQTLATGVHALKNPLSVVQGFAQLLHEELGDDIRPEAAHLLRRIEVNTARLWWRVDDLHRFIRLADVRLEREACPLDNVLAEAIRAVRRRGRVGDVHLAEGLPTVVGDFARLVELFEALLDNALLYQSPGTAPEVWVTGEGLDSLARIAVRDNGQGIAPEDRSRIFEPFQRLHRHDEIEGTGLGLASAARIAERHGGHIEVHAAPTSGSIFLVTLPF